MPEPVSIENLAERTVQLCCEVKRGLADAFFPRDCLQTGQLVDESTSARYFSSEGLAGITQVRQPHCDTCGFPFFGELVASRRCPHCIELDPVFAQGRTLFLARDSGRTLIHELKYRRGRYVLDDIALLLGQSPEFLAFLSGAWLVPVPLFPRRERARTYNQSRLLAECFAQAAQGSQVANILRRTRDTASQTRLNRQQRRDNVKNAFALQAGISLCSDDRYIIVDDVFTTGATLDACARALQRAGASCVDVATLGHG